MGKTKPKVKLNNDPKWVDHVAKIDDNQPVSAGGMLIAFSDLIEENGKSIRQNNMEKKHKYVLGQLVKIESRGHKFAQGILKDDDGNEIVTGIEGKGTFVINGLFRDCDGTPLYSVSTESIIHPDHVDGDEVGERNWRVFLNFKFQVGFCSHGFGEDSLKPLGPIIKMRPLDTSFMF